MGRKIVLTSFLITFFIGMLGAGFEVRNVHSNETIDIKADTATTLPSDMPVVFVDPQNKTANPGDTITISVKIFNLTNTVYLGHSSPPTPDTWAWGEPLPPPGGRYNYSLGNLFAFEIQFSWSPLILDYVSHTVKVPVETYPDGVLHDPVFLVNDTVDDDAGTYAIAYSSIGLTTPVFNCPDDNATFLEMTFNVIRIGKSHLNITWSDLAVPPQPGYMDFFYAIPHTVKNGQFQTEILATRIESLKAEPFDNSLVFSPPVISGENALIRATFVNDGSTTDIYNLTLYWGTTLLRSWQDEILDAGELITFNYTIDEADLSPGNHTITASISVLHGGFHFTDETIKQFKVIGPPQLIISGPSTGTLGDTVVFASLSYHSDPNGEILLYTWTLWAPGEIYPRETTMGENATFDLDYRWSIGDWIVKLMVRDNYGVEYNGHRPATAAWLTTTEIPLIPEFPSLIILPLFMFASLLAVLVYRRKRVISRV